jgi:hypothetical protein
MRIHRLVPLVVGLVFAQSAAAAPLSFQGLLTVEVGGIGVSLSVSGSGVAQVDGSGGGLHLDAITLPAGAFSASQLRMPLTDPGVFPVAGIQLTVSNQTGAFSAAGGGLGGPMPLDGSFRFCLQAPCGSTYQPANLVVPLTGVAGTDGTVTAKGAVNLTVIGAPWTTGTAAIGTITRMGFAHGPESLASSTAQTSGVVQLVTPIFISTNLGASSVLPGFATLTLHFVPEPGTLALLAAGILAFAWRGARSR